MKTILIAIALLFVLPSTPLEARRRRRKKPNGKVVGVLQAPWLQHAASRRQTRAYWSFAVPNLQLKRTRASYGDFLVFLDVWDEMNAPNSDGLLQIVGAELRPRMLIIPRKGPKETITVHSLDMMEHRLTSKDHPELKHLVLQRNSKSNVQLDNVLPLQNGETVTYRVRSLDLKHLWGEIVFVRSTCFTLAGADGRFELTGVPKGTYRLRVYYRGKILLTRPVEVGRKAVNLKVLTLKQAD
ncbi:MAG: carboxypeptidase-like regulatory domain-containing protein [bacterium]